MPNPYFLFPTPCSLLPHSFSFRLHYIRYSPAHQGINESVFLKKRSKFCGLLKYEFFKTIQIGIDKRMEELYNESATKYTT